jgi:hypothetical protein
MVHHENTFRAIKKLRGMKLTYFCCAGELYLESQLCQRPLVGQVNHSMLKPIDSSVNDAIAELRIEMAPKENFARLGCR